MIRFQNIALKNLKEVELVMGTTKASCFCHGNFVGHNLGCGSFQFSNQLMITQQVVFCRKKLELTWVVYGVKIRPSYSYLQLERGCV